MLHRITCLHARTPRHSLRCVISALDVLFVRLLLSLQWVYLLSVLLFADCILLVPFLSHLNLTVIFCVIVSLVLCLLFSFRTFLVLSRLLWCILLYFYRFPHIYCYHCTCSLLLFSTCSSILAFLSCSLFSSTVFFLALYDLDLYPNPISPVQIPCTLLRRSCMTYHYFKSLRNARPRFNPGIMHLYQPIDNAFLDLNTVPILLL